jgi:predicted dienelactone hydrolase
MTRIPYDPFAHGPYPVGVRTVEVRDTVRDRVLPAEIRYPSDPGPHPLVVYSHHSGGHRRSATFLTTHLASHGYAVAALDHSEVVVPALARRDGENTADRAARIAAIIDGRLPDVRCLLDQLLDVGLAGADIELDRQRIGLVGHSFGGWTVLAAAEIDPRVRSAVAHAPGGSGNPRPGVLSLSLSFDGRRDVPTLFLAAEHDVPVPPDAVLDVFDRTPATKLLVTLRRADHQHFVDDVEGAHEAARAMSLPAEAAWMSAAMRPMTELCSGVSAHVFVRGLTLAHFDATLRADEIAQRFLADDVERELASRGVDAIVHRP